MPGKDDMNSFGGVEALPHSTELSVIQQYQYFYRKKGRSPTEKRGFQPLYFFVCLMKILSLNAIICRKIASYGELNKGI